MSSSDSKRCHNQPRDFNVLFASGIFKNQLIKPDNFKLLGAASPVYAASAPHTPSILRQFSTMESQGLLLVFHLFSVLPVRDFFLAPHLVFFFTGLRYKCKFRFCALWLNGELSEKKQCL